jgi:fibronectin type III domain protein
MSIKTTFRKLLSSWFVPTSHSSFQGRRSRRSAAEKRSAQTRGYFTPALEEFEPRVLMSVMPWQVPATTAHVGMVGVAVPGGAAATSGPVFQSNTLSAVALDADKVQLTWTNVKNVANFSIEVQTASGGWRTVVDHLGTALRTYTLTGLESGMTFKFQLTAHDNASHTASVRALPVTSPTIFNQAIANAKIIDSLDVNHHWLSSGENTYCNVFLDAATTALGARVPQRLASGEITANQQQDWLLTTGKQLGWQELSAADAQRAANRGSVVVATWKNPGGAGDNHGHVAVVRYDDHAFDSTKGPRIAQAGGHNFNDGYAADRYGFTSAHLGAVRYFAYKPH